MKPALHIVIYSELRLYGGGRETWLAYFLPTLAARRVFRDIFVHCMRSDAPEDTLPHRWNAPGGTPVSFLPSTRSLYGPGGAPRRFAAFARGVRAGLNANARAADLLLAIGVHGEAPASLLGALEGLIRRRQLRLVTWVREASVRMIGARRGKLVEAGFGLLQRALLHASARIVTNGADTLALYRELFPELQDRLVNVPNAVDAARFQVVSDPEWSARPLRVGYLGRFLREKGFLDLLAAAARCLDETGLEFSAWGHRLDADGVPPVPPPNLALNPPAPQERVFEALAQCHVLLFLNRTPWTAGLSHALLEALAAGRPIVAWDVPCHSQVIDHENGFLVAEGDLAGLTRALRSLLTEPESSLRARSEAARRTASAYSPEAHVERFLTEVATPLLDERG